jgi:hypothetical protein
MRREKEKKSLRKSGKIDLSNTTFSRKRKVKQLAIYKLPSELIKPKAKRREKWERWERKNDKHCALKI